ncbi:MAG: hypothetical protein JSS43_20170 [Proteobacteria bacterium]|nr:hypothetical protein [Pseudomonadota bacterium]
MEDNQFDSKQLVFDLPGLRDGTAHRGQTHTADPYKDAELRLREREIALKERELEAKVEEIRRSRLTNPLVVAIFAAAIAGLSSAVVAFINGTEQRAQDERRAQLDSTRETQKAKADRILEEGKAEAARILEMIKTNEPDKAAANLSFLLETGLIADEERRNKLRIFLDNRKEGQGPSLPALGQIFGPTQKSLYIICKIRPGEWNDASVVSDLSKVGLQANVTTNGLAVSQLLDPQSVMHYATSVELTIARRRPDEVMLSYPYDQLRTAPNGTAKSAIASLKKYFVDPSCVNSPLVAHD